MRRKRACCASSQERDSAMAPAPRKTRRLLGVSGCSRYVGARPCTVGERPLPGALYNGWTDQHVARRGTRTPQARVLRLLPRERQRNSACATRNAPLAWRGRPQLTYWSIAVHRKKEASRWCSGLVWFMKRLKLARRGARTRQARVLSILPRERERSGVIACAHTHKPAACWRPLVVCQSTVPHRGRE